MDFVDVHAHFFNTRYLPVEGVARHYAGLGRFLAASITRLARTAGADDDSLESDRTWPGAAIAGAVPAGPPAELTPRQAIEWYVANLPDAWLLSDEYHDLVRELRGPGPAVAAAGQPPATPEARRRQLESLLAPPGLAGAGVSGAARDAGGFLTFVRNIMRSEKNLAEDFFGMSPEVGLFVHQMMDMQIPFASDPDYDYGRCVRRTRQLCRQSATRGDGRVIVPFVAFDAYRPDSTSIVADALVNRSFVGVKFYPPCGYRPDDNRNAEFAPNRIEQDHPEILDQRCATLFDVCVAHDAPIMAHTSQGGMEVIPGVTGVNSNPINWKIQLRDRPNLRLCFGHAGGESEWFPPPSADPWLPHIVELCVTCPNVYLDLSHKEQFLDAASRDVFAEQFAKTLADHEHDPFPLRTKVIYGSDFPMPLPGTRGWTNYYRSVRDLFDTDPRLSPHKQAVFRDNALRYLNLGHFIDARGGDLSAGQRAALEPFRA